MRILQILRAPVGGLFRHVHDLTRELAAQGHDIGILCDATPGGERTEQKLAELGRYCSLGIHRTKMHQMPHASDLSALASTYRLVRQLNPQIVHGHGAKGGLYSRLAGALTASSSVFYTPHGGSLHYDKASLKGRLFLAMERYLSGRTQGIIFESAYSAGVYCEKVGAPKCATEVIHNGLSDGDFVPRQLDDDASDFLFVGELRHLKGVEFFLRALGKIHEQREVSATIVGSGPDAPQFKQLARELGLEACTKFAGELTASRAFEMGRCLVVPSLAESLPYIILEGAAASLPMILTDVGGIPEITKGTDMDLVQRGEVAPLMQQMMDYLDHADLFEGQAAQLNALVASRFSVSLMADRIYHFYQNSLNDH